MTTRNAGNESVEEANSFGADVVTGTHTAPRTRLDKEPPKLMTNGCVSAARARLGRNLHQLELPLLQFSTEHGQMLGVAIACGRFLAVFHTVHLLSISYRKLLYSVERITAGETVDSKSRQ